MNQKYIDELRQKYIKNPPEGMTSKLVRTIPAGIFNSGVLQKENFP